MLNVIGSVPGILEFIVLLAAAVGGFFALKKYVYAPIKKHFKTVDAGMTTLLGYPEVKDPGSGRTIQPATPPLSARVYDLEATNKKMADALEIIAENQKTILRIQRDFDDRKAYGDQIVADFVAWRERVDAALLNWVSEQDELAHVIKDNLD